MTGDPEHVREVKLITPVCVNLTSDGVSTIVFDHIAQEFLVFPGQIMWVRDKDED